MNYFTEAVGFCAAAGVLGYLYVEALSLMRLRDVYRDYLQAGNSARAATALPILSKRELSEEQIEHIESQIRKKYAEQIKDMPLFTHLARSRRKRNLQQIRQEQPYSSTEK